MSILFKKRLIGAAILFLLLALLLPAFLTGSGDILSSSPHDNPMPSPPKGLQDELEEQIDASRQRQSQIREQQSIDGSSKEKEFPGREITVLDIEPEMTSNQENFDEKAVENTPPQDNSQSIEKKKNIKVEKNVKGEEAQEVQEVQEKKPMAKPKVRAKDLDLIGKIEKIKRKKWAVQVGAFKSASNADALVQKLKKNYKDSEIFIRKKQFKGSYLWIVFVGPVATRDEAEKRKKAVSKELKVSAVVRAYRDLGLDK